MPVRRRRGCGGAPSPPTLLRRSAFPPDAAAAERLPPPTRARRPGIDRLAGPFQLPASSEMPSRRPRTVPAARSRSPEEDAVSHRNVVSATVLLAAVACIQVASAEGFDKGNSVVWVGLNGNRSHIVSSPASLASLGEENE